MKHESSNARRIMRFASGPLAGPASGSRAENELFRTRVKMVPITRLKPNPNNARTHSAKQIRQIAESFTAFGVTNPPLVSEDMELITGHGRYEAAKLLGLSEMPVLIIAGLSRAKRRALAIADNRIAEGAGWDRRRLAIEIPELTELLSFEQLDISILGFQPIELQQIALEPIESAAGSREDRRSHHDIDPAWGEKAIVSRPGDLWILGPHKLLCGDGRLADHLRRLMGDDRADLAFIDLPGDGRLDDGERGLKRTLESAVTVSREGAAHFVFTNWACVSDLAARAADIRSRLLDVVVWERPTPSQGAMYRDQYELIGVVQIGASEGFCDTQSGRDRRPRSNVWRYPGAASLPGTFPGPVRSRARIVPLALIADAIKERTRRSDVVLDPACGAGVTIMAAQKLSRRARCVEGEPRLVDVAIRRWRAGTGQDAFHAGSGLPFGAVATKRGHEQDGVGP
jgi:DNA modification methylase